MGLDDNDDIARMFGRTIPVKKKKDDIEVSKEKPIIIDMVEEKTKPEPQLQSTQPSLDNIKFTPDSLSGVGSNVGQNIKNVPPFVLIGIGLIIAGNFSPYKWLFTIGFCSVIIGVFDKFLTPGKKQIMKDKLLAMFKKKVKK